MFSRHQRKLRLLFALADILLVTVAFAGAYQTRRYLSLEREFFLLPAVIALLLGVSWAFWPALGVWLRIYERLDAAPRRRILRDSLQQTALGVVGVILVEYLLRLDLSRPFLGLFAAYNTVLLVVFRLNAPRLSRWLRREFGGKHYVLLAGTGARAERLAHLVDESAAYGLHLIGFLSDDGSSEFLGRPVYPRQALSLLLERHVIDEVIFAVESPQLADLEDVLLLCDEEGVRTRVAVDFFPHVNSEIYLDRLQHTPLLTFAAAPHDEVLLFLKRATDVALAAAGLILLAPILLLVTAAVRLDSTGPVIFRQTRCGLNGRRFTFYKFRSMVENADALRPSLEHLNQKSVAFKIPNDPRLTRIGHFLRRFSVDELPQLWNVLRGDMAIVGPRPPVPEEVEKYQRWQRRRLRMRPGLTCLWALDGRDALDFDTWMRRDLEYIDNWTLLLDWKIILGTIPRVLSGRGAH